MSRPSPAFPAGQAVRLHQDPDLGVLIVIRVHWSLFQCWAYDLRCPDGSVLEKVFGEFLTRASNPEPALS